MGAMDMTPREIIRRNLEGLDAPRIGMNFSGGRWNDFTGGGASASASWTPRRWTDGGVEYYDDEWGNLWHRLVGMSSGGEIHTPALADWSALETYRLPDLDALERYEAARAAFAAEGERFRMGWLPGFPFAICRYLRKMEVYFQDLATDPELIERLHGMVADLLERVIIRLADAGADGIFFCEDWGVQNRLLISPAMFRRLYKPHFARLCGAARSRGMHVFMHSCGWVWDILPDLAEVGVSAMQFDQPALCGLEALSGRFHELGLALHAPVDIQKVMPTGDRALIEGGAQEMLRLFEGRLIAKDYPDLHGIGVAPEWDGWAYDVFRAAAERGAAGAV